MSRAFRVSRVIDWIVRAKSRVEPRTIGPWKGSLHIMGQSGQQHSLRSIRIDAPQPLLRLEQVLSTLPVVVSDPRARPFDQLAHLALPLSSLPDITVLITGNGSMPSLSDRFMGQNSVDAKHAIGNLRYMQIHDEAS